MTQEAKKLLRAAERAANHFGVLKELGVNLSRGEEGDEDEVLDKLDEAIENCKRVGRVRRSRLSKQVRSLEI